MNKEITNRQPPDIITSVYSELKHALAKFPTWPTDPLHALAVLGEEFGELTKDVLQMTYEPGKTNAENVRNEAIQTAAMALRFAASLNIYIYKDRDYRGPVYIGRDKGYRGRWGNQFVVGKDGTREEVIAKYRTWLFSQPELLVKVQQELRGKDLICFCAPKPCHGDVLLEVANSSQLYLKFD